MTKELDLQRRRLLAAGAGSAAAGLAGWTPALGQPGAQQPSSKPLPKYAAWKDGEDLIVHSANTIETERSAFGMSGITPSDMLFVRNNLSPPDASIVESPDDWTVEFDGVTKPHKLALRDLKRLGVAAVPMVLQCSGNGRGFFDHKASGTQWRTGACGNTLWGGVPVKRVVEALGGVREGMRYMTSTGGEAIPPGIDATSVMVERSVPWTAMEGALLAWELNGEPVPLAHGGPLRIIIPGYYGVNHVKYVKRVAFTAGQSPAAIQQTGYRVRPIGVKGAPTQPSMWEMNLKSFITYPLPGDKVPAGMVQVHGVAFAGDTTVHSVEVSLDGGRAWDTAEFFGPDLGRFAWRQFVLPARLQAGTHVIASRATGANGQVQPEQRLENERGYGHNGWRDHAVRVTVA
jgi:sulfite dehydrogenase